MQYEQLFYAAINPLAINAGRKVGTNAVTCPVLRPLVLYQNDVHWPAKVLGAVAGLHCHDCIHDYLEIFCIETGQIYEDVVTEVLRTGGVQPAELQTIAVEVQIKQLRQKLCKTDYKAYVFTGLYWFHELGLRFMELFHLRAVDILRFLPVDAGDKIVLWCQTKAPLRGQEEFWTPELWWPFPFSLEDGVWLVHTGVNSQVEVSSWHLYQQIRRVKIMAPARYARTYAASQHTFQDLSAWDWQRTTGQQLGITMTEVHQGVPTHQRGRRVNHRPGDVHDCVVLDMAGVAWRRTLETQLLLNGCEQPEVDRANTADRTAGQVRDPSPGSAFMHPVQFD